MTKLTKPTPGDIAGPTASERAQKLKGELTRTLIRRQHLRHRQLRSFFFGQPRLMRHLDRRALELSYLLKAYEALGVWPLGQKNES